MQYRPLSAREELVAKEIVNAAFQVHTKLGPGMLESVYETCLCHELGKRKIPFKRQVYLPVIYDELRLEQGYRLDVIVDDLIICEIKSSELISKVHYSQIVSYLKLTQKRLGFLINFNVPMIREGIRRIIL